MHFDKRHIYSDTIEALEKGEILVGLKICLPWVNKLHDAEINEKYETILGNYERLTRYFQEGQKDPHREEQHRKLVREAFELFDKVYLRMRINTNSSSEFEWLRALTSQDTSNPQSASVPQGAFYHFFLAPAWTKELQDEYHKLLFSNQQDDAVLAVYALTLQLFRTFSIDAFMTLADTIDYHDGRLRAIAMVGLCLASCKYGPRVGRFYPEIVDRCMLLHEKEECRHLFNFTFLQLARSLKITKAEKAVKDMQDTILKRLGDNKIDNPLNIIEVDEDLPEWLESATSGLRADADILRKLVEDKVDINYAHLTSSFTFPFFTRHFDAFFRVYNPYDNDVELNTNTTLGEKVVQIVADLEMCDCDKHAVSLIYSNLRNIPLKVMENPSDDDLKIIIGQFGLSCAAMLTRDELLIFNVISTLYRFATCNRFKYDFNWRYLVPDMSHSFIWMHDNMHCAEQVGVFDIFSEMEEYSDAFRVYNHYFTHIGDATDQEWADAYKRMGYASEKTWNVDPIEFYNKALILNPADTWVMWRLAKMYYKVREYVRAMEMIDQLIELEGEKSKYLYFKVKILGMMGTREDLIQALYHIEMLFPDYPPAKALINCIKGNFGPVVKFYHDYDEIIDFGLIAKLGVPAYDICILRDLIFDKDDNTADN